MAAELSGIERLLAGRIGLDPVSVGSPLIFARSTAANEGAGAGRHGRLRALGATVGARSSNR